MGELRAAGFHPVGIGDNVPAEFTPLRDRIALDTSHLLLSWSAVIWISEDDRQAATCGALDRQSFIGGG